MKRHLLAFLLLCACAPPLTDIERSHMQEVLPKYQAMSLEELRAIDTTLLDGGQQVAFKKALREAEKQRRKEERAERKRLAQVIKAYKYTDIRRSPYERDIRVYGRSISELFSMTDSSWYLAASFGPDGASFEVIYTVDYNNFDYNRTPDDPPPQITPGSWRIYNRASFYGGEPAAINNTRQSDSGCDKVQCDFEETVWIDLPYSKIIEALENGGDIDLRVVARSGDKDYITISHGDLVGYIRRIHDELGYFKEATARFPELREPLPIK
ncbi:hypothetical protein [Kordiimonas marina]|uniref:hypothetical protein n=1 Tax=Kordiimonas marina TaxID=2872312 RepID=UPI001FF28423|nr:hypothetical protein [Kordiimonas marina]MCJ9427666.1 hypothetical protein [Kordiimonas marina]